MEFHRNLDLLLRRWLNEIIGYKFKHLSMSNVFKELGKDYNNRQDYGQVMGIINKDRNDFCQEIWDNAKDFLVEHTVEAYKVLYKKCLESWYKKNRTLLYKLGDGWGTPLEYDTFRKIEEQFARRDAQLIINKVRQLELTNIELPYKESIDKLELELKKIEEDSNLLE